MKTVRPGLVSVLMPVYNGAEYIRQAIQSVISQTHRAWELIIVDDGSTDNTADVISSFSERRLLYAFQDNRGQAAALNRALELARGEYITTLDADDWFTADSLSSRVTFLATHPECDVVYGDGIYCDKNGNALQRFADLRSGDVSGDVFDVLLSNCFVGTGANVMVRQTAIDKHLIRYDETIVWCQDYDFYLRLAAHCQFGCVDTPTVWYRLHTTNMTMTMPAGRKKESLVRVKYKALATSRFSRTTAARKVDFFYHLLLDDLDSLPAQLSAIRHPHFVGLPESEQGRLIRLVATTHLLAHRYPGEVRELLRAAFRLNPFDVRAFVLVVVTGFALWPAHRAVTYWRQVKWRTANAASPFAQVKQ